MQEPASAKFELSKTVSKIELTANGTPMVHSLLPCVSEIDLFKSIADGNSDCGSGALEVSDAKHSRYFLAEQTERYTDW